MTLSTRLLIALLTGGALFFGGYFLGKSDEREDQQARLAVAQGAAIARHDQAAAAGLVVERKVVHRAVKADAYFSQLKLGATRHAQTLPAADCGLDADGLRLWQAASAGPEAAAAGEPDGAMPGAADAGVGGVDGPAEQPHRRDAPVPPLPGPADGAGAMAGDDR